MKNLFILKRLIFVYYYLILVLFGIGIIVIPFLLLTGKKTEISFLGDKLDLNQLSSTKIIIIMLLIGFLYFLYFLSIKLIKNTVGALTTGSYFTEEIISNFKKIGQYFIVIGIGATIVKLLVDLILRSQISFGLDGGMLVFVLFGLFFMFLSEAFSKAKAINEENELTV